MKYEPVIGLEIHVELKTKTKMFCFSLNDPDEKHPNTNICSICMGHPGTLPAANKEAVKKVIQVGLALGGEIPEFSQFDRKNYFYPDLPKGYQISQYKYPLVQGGHLEILGRKIRITRVHLEEDTGRLIHGDNDNDYDDNNDNSGDKKSTSSHGHRHQSSYSLVDFNRAGIPLMELVTEPDLRTGEEVKKFGEELQRILRYIGASDADMEKGQMRVEVNISLREIGAEKLGTKVEIKNINSFKFAADAVDYEVKRQTKILESGEKVVQETRGWNEFKKETFSQRSKEEAHDYRYFPEPDLPPLKISREFVAELKSQLPELPAAKRGRFIKEYALEPEIADILIRDKSLADYFEAVVSELKQHDKEIPRPSAGTPAPTSRRGLGAKEKSKKPLPTLAASFLTGEFLRILAEASAPIEDTRVSPENFAELVLYVAENKISNLVAKQVLMEMFRSGEDPSDVIDRLGLWQLSDKSDLEDIARHIVEENPKAVEDYKKGKEASLQFLVGQVMKESRGKANPKAVKDILKKIL